MDLVLNNLQRLKCHKTQTTICQQTFLLYLWPFFGDFFHQTYQKFFIIFAIDGSSFLKVINEQNTLHILKYLCVCIFGCFG